MPKQTITFGNGPMGIGGDTYKTAFIKTNENFTELYDSTLSAVTTRIPNAQTDFNTLTKAGTYFAMFGMSTGKNGPPLVGNYGFLKVTNSGSWILQEAFGDVPPFYAQMRVSINGTWGAWGNLAQVDKLRTARLINGVAFDGSKDITIRDSKAFKADGPVSDVTSAEGPAWNANSGVYRMTRSEDTALVTHFKCDTSSTTALQLYANYGNGGLFYRSSRDQHGFEKPWERLITETGGTITGALSAKNIQINKMNNQASGISWYNESYSSWQTYMATALSTGNGVKGTITAPKGKYVTTWGLRNVIEDQGGYGWTFETMPSQGTTPLVVAEVSSIGEMHLAKSLDIGSTNGAKDTEYHKLTIHPPTHTGGDWTHTVYDDQTYAYYRLKYANTGQLQLRSDGKLEVSALESAGDIVTRSGIIGSPNTTYHHIDLGGNGKDRMNFTSYAGLFQFKNGQGTNVATINTSGVTAPNFYGAATNLRPQRIGENADLNNYVAVGEYYSDSDANVRTMLNTPNGFSFTMSVTKTAGVVQKLTNYTGQSTRNFVRGFYNGGWSAWRELVYKDELTDLAPGVPTGAVSWGMYNREKIPAGLASLDGQWVLKTTFPKLWELVNAGNLISVTDADWVADPLKRSAFAIHPTDAATFRLPDLNGRFEASLKSPVLRGDGYSPSGTMLGDAIRNFTAKIGHTSEWSFSSAADNGIMYRSNWQTVGSPNGTSNQDRYLLNLDASRQVPTANENRPNSAFGIYVIAVR